MERIQNILQRLQELYYSKHQKSAIDIDLMLDYTRVMYADLLEWKQNVPSTGDDKLQYEEAEKTLNNEEAASQQLGSEEKEHNVKIDHEELGRVAVIEDTQQQVANLVEEEGHGISFEPPHPVAHPEVVDEVLITEAPQINEPVENIEIPLADEELPPVASPLTAGISTAKDIRSGIGINDKYLFLNELFNNHKTEYEEALDRLNRFNGFEEAYNWVIANTAVNNKWAEDDETVQNFFALLKKHFSVSR